MTVDPNRMLFAILLLSFSFSATAYHEANEPTDGTVRSFKPVSSPTEVPSIQFLDGNGQSTDFKAYRGKVVLLNLWATWCGPCIRELPALDRLQAKFADSDFVVLPISIDKEGIAITQPWYQRFKLQNLGLYNDPTKALGVFFPLDVVPANFIIDRHGKENSFLRSFVDWDEPLASEMIRHYINQHGATTTAWSPMPVEESQGIEHSTH